MLSFFADQSSRSLPRPSVSLLFVFFTMQCLFSQAIRAGDLSVMQNGKWRIDYNLNSGLADISCADRMIVRQMFAEVKLPEVVTSKDYKFHETIRLVIHDGFGTGVEFHVESWNNSDERMTQTFRLYDKLDFLLMDVKVSRRGGVASNFMSPLMSDTPSAYLPMGDNRVLFVPFDNDMWVRYRAFPSGGTIASYEVSAFYDNASRQGLIIGSIEHDKWKTGIVSTTASNAITKLEVYGGITSSNITHDILAHGKISGDEIGSPNMFIGCFSDWRDGLETYASANAVITPPRRWDHGVPFGWNSWGKLQFGLNYTKAIQVSDFFARELPQFQDQGVAYIGLDAGWDALTDEQLKQFADHCHTNHQLAGIYFTPFTAWGRDGEKEIEGTSWHYKDIYLYANGKTQTIDGGIALDPTHPGTQTLIRSVVRRFQRDGFSYIKADFMTHGALEADRHYDSSVTTGMEAYNVGMRFIDQIAGDDMYLNLSISPLFPAQYANSRRISCDTFGRIDQTEYMMNSLTYGWWLDKVYDFNDADHMVLDGFSEGENRARISSSAITGVFISGDDFSDEGGKIGKLRTQQFLTNSEICNLVRMKKSFWPVEGNTGDRAANLFCYRDGDRIYLAAFNFMSTNAEFAIDPKRIGLKPGTASQATELWSGMKQSISGPWTIDLLPKDAALYRIQ